MPSRRNRDINDIYEQELEQRIIARMDERFDQFVGQFVDRMNDMMNPRRRGDRNGRRSEGEESENPFFEGNGSSSDEQPDRPRTLCRRRIDAVYDTDIEDIIEEEEFVGKGGFDGEEDNIEDVVVVANDLCSSMIQNTLNVDFEEDINTKSHELIRLEKVFLSREHDDPTFFGYISGLRDQIIDYVNMFVPMTLFDAYQRVLDFEKQKRRVGSSSSPAITGGSSSSGNVASRFVPNQARPGSVFDDDRYEEESMPVYAIDIEDVIEEEEGFIRKRGLDGEEDNIEDVVVVANDLCSSMIQTTLNVDFEEDINTKSHELMSFGKKYSYQGTDIPHFIGNIPFYSIFISPELLCFPISILWELPDHYSLRHLGHDSFALRVIARGVPVPHDTHESFRLLIFLIQDIMLLFHYPLYPFTERNAQPYSFACVLTADYDLDHFRPLNYPYCFEMKRQLIEVMPASERVLQYGIRARLFDLKALKLDHMVNTRTDAELAAAVQQP
ncbi:hypothetical protein Tco_1032741 [Tanacetum coccineum]|uniref:Uncharacterized protein n=1 Tax=Tanacetum coccineum TaxID=301880 RepID=A0ABQ5GE50_9ASTR